MLNVDEKVAVKIIKANSNKNKHIVAPLQCQVKRHMSTLEEEYEHINVCTRRIPVPWSEVNVSDTKTASETIMAKSALRNYRKDSTKQRTEVKENICTVTQVRFNMPQKNNKM